MNLDVNVVNINEKKEARKSTKSMGYEEKKNRVVSEHTEKPSYKL